MKKAKLENNPTAFKLAPIGVFSGILFMQGSQFLHPGTKKI